MNSRLEFPDFLHGSFASLSRGIQREGKRWATHYKNTRALPAPSLQAIEPGTVVRTLDVTDLERRTPQWRLYFTQRLGDAIIDAEEWESPFDVRADFESYVRRFAWGALSTAVSHAAPNTTARVSERLHALLSFWEPLDSLRYIGHGPVRVVSLTELVEWHFESLMQMWLEARSHDVRDDLRRAVEAMRAASPEIIRERVIGALARVARSDDRTRRFPLLADPAWLSGRMDEIDRATLENVETGNEGQLLRLLFILQPDATSM